MEIPKHIALIPDGNRRWADGKGMVPWEGHAAGIKRFRDFLEWCYEVGVEEVTAYSLSKENLKKRTHKEVEFLFELFEENLYDVLKAPEVKEKEMRVKFLGDLDPLPESVRELILEVESKTKNFCKRKLNLCINYSGREEILNAVNELAKSGAPVNEKNFEKSLWVRSYPDLLIRTAEHRISNFLLWQSAYSEIFFSPKLFPNFSRDDFMEAIKQYNQTQRRYGK